MAAGQLSALQFILRLNDQVTGPMGRVSKTVLGRAHAMAAGVNRATGMITSGFLAATAGGAGLAGALLPAIDHARALGEVKSLGVAADALQALDKEARRFTNSFGGSATEVVRSAYDIQSAIAGLRGDELARFTSAANLTSKATKATGEEVTAFFGTMHGIFEQKAAAMGRAKWVDMLAGQTAETVRMFKTTGSQISQAFTGIGAAATTMGVGMAEQFAIMGTLQATMPGPEAGTKYRSFLFGLGTAQKEFDLKFTDSAGMLLSMPKILDLIRPKLAGLNAVAQADVLMKAFGRKEAVALVQLLIGRTGELTRSIGGLNRIRGLGPAVDMAKDIVQPWDRFVAGVRNFTLLVETALLPILNPWIEKMTQGAAALQSWTEKFPALTRLIGLAVGSFFLMALAVGVVKIGMGLFALALAPLKFLLWGAWAGIGKLLLVLQPLKLILLGARAAMWLFNLALLANPITWVVAGVLLLVGAVALAIIYWDKLKGAVVWVAEWFDNLPGWAQAIGFYFVPFLAIPAKIIANWGKITAFFSRWVREWFGPGTVMGTLLGNAFGIDVSGLGTAEKTSAPTSSRGLPAPEPLAGEAKRAISNIASTNNSRRVRIGQVTIQPKEELGPDFLFRLLVAEGMA